MEAQSLSHDLLSNTPQLSAFGFRVLVRGILAFPPSGLVTRCETVVNELALDETVLPIMMPVFGYGLSRWEMMRKCQVLRQTTNVVRRLRRV